MSGNQKSRLQEKLVRLYLRLNGYFQSGLIIHSPRNGSIRTEIDCIGVRFPFHNQRERQVEFSAKLKIPDSGIDVVIGEVKNFSIDFNRPLQSDHSEINQTWSQMLRWIGLWAEDELQPIIEALMHSVSNPEPDRTGSFKPVVWNSNFGEVNLRLVFFSIEKPHQNEDLEDFINGNDIIDYIWECLRPELSRSDCSTTYPYTNWNEEFEELVTWIKAQPDKPSLEDFYQAFNITTQ